LEKYMQIALDLAKERKGYTHPNPTVGAIILKDGKIIGKGYHYKAGMPHAEREAIKDAKSKGYDLKGSTMFVTLEPCCHYGKTPPCTNAILEEGISKVVVATLDPNPLVAGKGVEILKQNGVEVVVGVLEDEAKKLNEDFFVYITKKRPFVHLKVAQTFDGKIATKTGSSKWITSQESRKFAHILRNQATAVLVGSNTALIDNPSLTVRYIQTEKQPVRVLLDSKLKVPLDYNIYNNQAKTIVITSKIADSQKLKELSKKENVQVYQLDLFDGKFKIKDILEILYQNQIVHLLVEGGKEVITSFVRENIFDKISLFMAPKIIGEDGISSFGSLGVLDIKDSLKLKVDDFKRFGNDFYFECYKEDSPVD
ncbi:MAG: bifunctional diaminohydroxyphosphoribosylaminopyrimidine deaminase/5-amino-6-(5-phosphoribosylamino)uracil reductase RibD, partial [Sulfurihydrogenibium sp.]